MPPDFRYDQFCPIARAAELLGQRWTLLVLRELFVGPQRFSDLKRRLRGVSTSVLSDRLAALERAGVVSRRELPPPAPASVYTLSDHGRALEPALLELARWGARFLGSPAPSDHMEPDWFALAIDAFGAAGPTPARRFELRVEAGGRTARVRLEGGEAGTRRSDEAGPVDLVVEAPILVLMGLVSRALAPADLRASGAVRLEGDVAALDDLASLFRFPGADSPAPVSASARPPTTNQEGNTP